MSLSSTRIFAYILVFASSQVNSELGDDDFDDIFEDELWLGEIDTGETLNRVKRQFGSRTPVIKKFETTASIVARFSQTEIKSTVYNPHFESQMVVFETQLPKIAFISNFSMIIGTKEYFGVVKKKAVAVSDFENAAQSGQNAGLVQVKQRETVWFKVSTNVAATQTVIFKLQYQQLIVKKLDKYEQVVFADPGQSVDEFIVNFYITEPTGLKQINAQYPFTGPEITAAKDVSFPYDIRQSKTQAQIHYYRKNYLVWSGSPSGRRFVVSYNVNNPDDAGTIWTHNGYFAHFFAPNEPLLPKKVAFVIDVSGSMYGDKLIQTKAAWRVILNDLKEDDSFNIITFHSSVSEPWKTGFQMASSSSLITQAQSYVDGLRASGGTNLDAALKKAITILDEANSIGSGGTAGTSTIFLLTDGDPTVGERNLETIRKNILSKNRKKYPIFTLGFGNDVKHEFLKQLALENNGETKKIFIGTDGGLQIKGFFNTIANPILTDLTLSYLGNVDSESVTKTNVPVFYKGSEYTVMGKLETTSGATVQGNIQAFGKSQRPFAKKVSSGEFTQGFTYPVAANIGANFNNFFERMWAYLTISQLLDLRLTTQNAADLQKINNKILELSLNPRHNLVTPLTAMVVLSPENQPNQLAIFGEKPSTLPTILGNPGPIKPSTDSVVPSGGSRRVSWGSSRRRRRYRLGATAALTTTTRATTTTKATTTATTTQEPVTLPPFQGPPVPSHPDYFSKTINPSNCGQSVDFTGNMIKISTPGVIYPRNAFCKWEIYTKPVLNQGMELSFTKFDLEYHPSCARDRMTLYLNDEDSPNPEHRAFCGFHMNPYMQIYGRNKITIIFESDDVVQGTGFEAVIRHLTTA